MNNNQSEERFELIKINQSENGNKTVLASELYNLLQPKTQFNHWIKRMFKYGFVENVDYSIITNDDILLVKNDQQKSTESLHVKKDEQTQRTKVRKSSRGGHNIKDYLLTIESAKSIAMVQRSEIGKRIRNYFIEVEKHYQEIATPKQIAELNNRLKSVEKKQINFINDWSVDRFLRANGVFKKHTIIERQQLGKLCTKEYKKITGNPPKKVQHPSYVNGQNVYPYELISKVYSSKF